jgi:hypothetical protein
MSRKRPGSWNTAAYGGAQPVDIPGNIARTYRAMHRPNLTLALIAGVIPGEATTRMATDTRPSAGKYSSPLRRFL